MRAVDANIVLRLLVADDIAEAIFEEPVILTLTVILETAWVLRSNYRPPRHESAAVLGELIDRSTVNVMSVDKLRWAIGRSAIRGDIANLIHIVAAGSASSFATFDKDVAAGAGADSPVPIETLA